MENVERKTSPRAWRLAARIMLAGYWITLFIGTHTPRVPQNLSGPDKPLHFFAYAGLGFLLATAVGAARRLRVGSYFGLWLLIIGYGAIDEWLQIPVGRSCELADWYADAVGAAAGLALYRIVAGLLTNRFNLFAWQGSDATLAEK